MERGEMFNGRVDMSQGAQAAFNSVHLYFWISRVLSLSPRLEFGVHAPEGSRPSFGTSSGS